MFSMLSNLGSLAPAPAAAASAAAAAAPSAPPAEPVYPSGFTLRVLNHVVMHDHLAGGKPIPLSAAPSLARKPPLWHTRGKNAQLSHTAALYLTLRPVLLPLCFLRYCVYVFPPGTMGHSKQNALHFRSAGQTPGERSRRNPARVEQMCGAPVVLRRRVSHAARISLCALCMCAYVRWKRFSEFDSLHKEVRKYPGRLPELPSKWKWKLKGKQADDGPLLEHRQAKLDRWCQALAEYYATSPSEYLRSSVMQWLNLHVNLSPVAHLEANVAAALAAAPPPPPPPMGGMFQPGFPFNQGPPPRPQPPPPGTQFSQAGQGAPHAAQAQAQAAPASGYAAPAHASASVAPAPAPAPAPAMGGPLGGMLGGGGVFGMLSAMKQPNFGGNLVQNMVNQSQAQKAAAAEAEAKHVASLSPEDRATHLRAKKMLARIHSSMGWAFSNAQTGHEEHWEFRGSQTIERKVHPSRTAGIGRWRSTLRIVDTTVRLSDNVVEFAISSAAPTLDMSAFFGGPRQAPAPEPEPFRIRIHVPPTAQDGGDGGSEAGDPSAPEVDPEQNHLLAGAQGGQEQAPGGAAAGGGGRLAAMRGQIGGLMGRLGGGGGGGAPAPRTLTIDFYGYKSAGFFLGTEMPALPRGMQFNLGAGAQLSAGEQAAYNREVNSRTFVEAPPPASIAYWPPAPTRH